MGIELDIETGILTIDEKYEIKPRITMKLLLTQEVKLITIKKD